jgi:two-component system chemotaxis sensor kinase CheA
MSDSDIVQDFLAESYENLDRLDRELVGLEKHPHDRDTLASVFRTIHTIKGTCGFLGFSKLEKVTHVGESLLARLRDGQLTLTPEHTTALLNMVDAVRQMLKEIQSTGQDGKAEYPELLETLTRLLPSPGASQPEGTPDAGAPPAGESSAPASAPGKEIAPASSENIVGSPAPISAAASKQPARKKAPKAAKLAPAEAGIAEATVCEATVSAPPAAPGPVQANDKDKVVAKPDEVPATQPSSETRPHHTAAETIRVGVTVLDRLMTLVGELVLARNQLLQIASTLEETSLQAVSQRMNLIATELQGEVMKTRLQPIGNIWSQFPRTVRDVALGCGKEVNIEMEGKETELDKTIIEAIKDPLTHLVRNSVDHGIELPAVRVKAGKDRAGRLILRAFHEGGQVNIEITDDGAGLNAERIRQKAVERGMVTAEQAAHMTEREIFKMIFLPGFSTAEKVTKVSGRGVGMDVVKTNVERIGGSVDVQSTAGRGTTVRVKIPLTLAIIPALVVTTGGDRYAIPQVSLLELVRIEADAVAKSIESVHGAPVYRLRGRLLPLVYLNQELNTGGSQGQGVGHPATESGSSWAMLDFSQARVKHQHWLGRLREVLDNKAILTAQQAGSHTECALGKWLYSIGLKNYANLAEIHSVEAAHTEFHALVAKILGLKEQGHPAEAEQAFQPLGSLSSKIIALLTELEKKVLYSQSVNIVVLQADDRQFGLVVDEINDTEEIVVKPLRKQLKTVKTFAGSSIMGDGKVALILDVLGLAQRASVVTETRDRALADKVTEVAGAAIDEQTFLLFAGPGDSRMAIPLSTLARLEEFPVAQVEMSGSQWVTQYRGKILPLIRLNVVLEERRNRQRALETPPAPGSPPIQVLVLNHEGRSFGLVVERILDIVEDRADVRSAATRASVLYSVVIGDRVTELLDVPAILRNADVSAAQPGLAAKSAGVAN